MSAEASSSSPGNGNGQRERVVPYTAGDGLELNLINVRGGAEPTRGPVVMVHGAGVRANIFRAPVRETLVDALVARGYDVWLTNWRASIDFAPNRWTLDQAARYDHPAAVAKIVEETGADAVKAVIHCQGSTSFTMSAMAGLVPQVDTILSNAVSLCPIVPWWSRVKLEVAVPVVNALIPYISPAWGDHAPTLIAKAIRMAVKASHHECQNDVCKMVSFTYGAGSPALWRHENINEETHDWLRHEFAEVPLRFFQDIGACVRKGNLVRYDQDVPDLPDDFAAQPPLTDARFVFYAGRLNRCFLPESQVRAFEHFDRWRPSFHKLNVLDDYSHLDVFMGERAATEVFPRMIAELDGEA